MSLGEGLDGHPRRATRGIFSCSASTLQIRSSQVAVDKCEPGTEWEYTFTGWSPDLLTA